MKKIILNGKEIATREQLHNVLKEGLGFPDYYLENLFSLSYSLSKFEGEGITIEWKHFKKSQEILGSYVDDVLTVLLESSKEAGKIKIIVK